MSRKILDNIKGQLSPLIVEFEYVYTILAI